MKKERERVHDMVRKTEVQTRRGRGSLASQSAIVLQNRKVS